MRIKSSEISHLAEIISAIAIVISLVFVGVQLHDNIKATKSATANQATAITLSIYLELLTDTERGTVFLDGIIDVDSLPPKQPFQFLMIMQSAFLAFQNAYYLPKKVRWT